MCRPIDGSRSYFRLEDRRHGLSLLLQTTLDPTKLRCIQSGHLNHGYPNIALVVDQFAAQRICESRNGVLSGAVCRLKRNASIYQRGADLDYRSSILRQHAFQSGESPVNNSQVRDLRDPFVFFGLHFLHWRKHGSHRVVYPDIDRSEFFFDGGGGVLNGPGVGNIQGKHHCTAACGFDLTLRSLEPIDATSDETDFGTMSSELACRGPAQAGRGSSNHNDFIRQFVTVRSDRCERSI